MLPITLLQLIFNIFYLRQCGSHIFKQLFSFVLCDAQWLRDTTIFVQAALAQLRSHRKAIVQVRLSELATVLIVQAALAQLGNRDNSTQIFSYTSNYARSSLYHQETSP